VRGDAYRLSRARLTPGAPSQTPSGASRSDACRRGADEPAADADPPVPSRATMPIARTTKVARRRRAARSRG
jgi:hypothetical protein